MGIMHKIVLGFLTQCSDSACKRKPAVRSSIFFLCYIVTFIRHRSEIGVCFVHKPDWNMKEVSEMQGHISMYVVEGLAEQREFVDKPCSDGVCKNQELANF